VVIFPALRVLDGKTGHERRNTWKNSADCGERISPCSGTLRAPSDTAISVLHPDGNPRKLDESF
jgi:hypothetical protein